MGNRLVQLVNNEYYHIFNRGVNKCRIFDNKKDTRRFLEGLIRFNNKGNISYKIEGIKKALEKVDKKNKIVEIVAYCLNPNHFHILLRQLSDKGIEKFIHKLCSSHSIYYNKKNDRTGPLFSGRFKSVHLDTDNKLLKISAYINLNYVVHNIENVYDLDIVKSSWEEYLNKSDFSLCDKNIVLGNFDDLQNYKDFCINIIKDTREIRDEIDLEEDIFIEQLS